MDDLARRNYKEGLLSVEELRELFSLNPETGVLVWEKGRKRGRVAGCVKNGYRKIEVFGYIYRAHRMVWAYVHGSWPVYEVDHKDKDKTNNAIVNLRHVTHQQNAFNRNGISNRILPLGVSRGRGHHKNLYYACLMVNGRNIYDKYFDTVEEAIAAYAALKNKYHPMGKIC